VKRLHRAALFAAFVSVASQASAQKPQIAIVLPGAVQLDVSSPSVRSQNLVTDGTTLEYLRNGFPARLHYRAERWSTSGWFDDIAAEAEWDVVVRYDPLAKVFQVFRVVGRQTSMLGTFATIQEAEAAFDGPFPIPISAPRKGRSTYYTLSVDIESLSLTELDELERWLRGDLKPAVRGKKNPGTAVGRGVRTVIVRMLGGEKRRYTARSRTFKP
jgi:hypothetical protein